MGMIEILPASFRYYNSCGRKTSVEKLGQPENQINSLGVHYANCVDLNYPGARIRAMMACASICFIPSSPQFRSFTMKHACRSIFEKGETAVPSGIYFL